MPEPEVITRELLEKWVRDAETGEVYSATSEGRLLRLCAALLAGVTPCDALQQFDGSPCPHGDETCPCQDGDICHYEGPDPMYCPLHRTTHLDGYLGESDDGK